MGSSGIEIGGGGPGRAVDILPASRFPELREEHEPKSDEGRVLADCL
jgi:hypothetical protein